MKKKKKKKIVMHFALFGSKFQNIRVCPITKRNMNLVLNVMGDKDTMSCGS